MDPVAGGDAFGLIRPVDAVGRSGALLFPLEAVFSVDLAIALLFAPLCFSMPAILEATDVRIDVDGSGILPLSAFADVEDCPTGRRSGAVPRTFLAEVLPLNVGSVAALACAFRKRKEADEAELRRSVADAPIAFRSSSGVAPPGRMRGTGAAAFWPGCPARRRKDVVDPILVVRGIPGATAFVAARLSLRRAAAVEEVPAAGTAEALKGIEVEVVVASRPELALLLVTFPAAPVAAAAGASRPAGFEVRVAGLVTDVVSADSGRTGADDGTDDVFRPPIEVLVDVPIAADRCKLDMYSLVVRLLPEVFRGREAVPSV